jgi:hypothetical protein
MGLMDPGLKPYIYLKTQLQATTKGACLACSNDCSPEAQEPLPGLQVAIGGREAGGQASEVSGGSPVCMVGAGGQFACDTKNNPQSLAAG